MKTIVVIVCTFALKLSLAAIGSPSHSDHNVMDFKHILLDPNTEHLYTIKGNCLVHRYSNFTEIEKVSLFPNEDNCNQEREESVNITAMALLSGWIMVCADDGRCVLHNKSRLTVKEKLSGSYINSPSVVLVLPNSTNLLVGSSTPKYGDIKGPVLSKLHLNVSTCALSPLQSRSADYPAVAPNTHGTLWIEFLSGFLYKGFAYFVTVQEDKSDEEKITRAMRVNTDSASVLPFVEIPLPCIIDGINYTRATSMLKNDSHVFLTFDNSSAGTAVCGFNLEDIENEMATRPQFSSNDQRVPDWLNITDMTTPHWRNTPTNYSIRAFDIAKMGKPYSATLSNDTGITLVDLAREDICLRNNESIELRLSNFMCSRRTTCEACVKVITTFKTECRWCSGKCQSRDKHCSNPCVIDDFSPKRGPLSGGTDIRFSGCNLPTELRVSIQRKNVEVPCNLVNKTQSTSSTLCKLGNVTNRAYNDGKKPELGNWTVKVANCSDLPKFYLKPDPNITSIHPKTTTTIGGTTLTIVGSDLDVIQKLQLNMVIQNMTTTYTNCTKKSSTEMHCPTPRVSGNVNESGTEAHLNFNLEGVNAKVNYTKFKMTVFPKPSLDNLPNNRLNISGKDPILPIRGNFKGVNETDVKITIGKKNCGDVATNDTMITCKPVYVSSNKPQNVTIRIGDNFKENYGTIVFIVYEPHPSSNTTNVIIATTLYAAIGSAIGTAVFVSLVLGVCCYCCWKDKQKAFHARLQSETTSTGFDEKILHAYFQLQPLNQPKLPEETIRKIEESHLLIQSDLLKVGAPIGSGNFGCVYVGQLHPEETEDFGEPRKVAIKTMNDSNQSLELSSFVEEALIMKAFDHPHVLALLGVSISNDQQPMVVLPFMANGDLLTYVSNERRDILVSDTVRWGMEVAEGMDYLSKLKLVHRDLAARNCMLDEHLSAKVADFGLSRDIYEKGYYSSDNKKKLPIRWMAPESIERGNYSSKSDVWSLGVVIWELLTRGATPYSSVQGWDIGRFLQHGRRLQQPWFCSSHMYDLLLQMWSVDPCLRPTFSEVVESLSQLKLKTDQKVTSRDKDDVTELDKDGGYVIFPDCTRYVDLPAPPEYFVLEQD